MTINWFTVIAQMINFLVLVFLLQRFLYGPIVNTMEERQEKVAARLQDAEEAREEAEQEAEEYRRKQAELEEERESMMAEMREEIESRRQELLQEIRKESERMRREWKRELERDEEQFMLRLRSQISDEFFTLARHALADLADAELESQAAKAFLRHIREMDEEQWREFREAAAKNGEPIVVRSAFELSEDLQEEIEETLEETTDEDIDLRFEIDSSLIAGIELQAHSHIAAWQMDNYLDALQNRAQATLQNKYQEEDEPNRQAEGREKEQAEGSGEESGEGQDERQAETA